MHSNDSVRRSAVLATIFLVLAPLAWGSGTREHTSSEVSHEEHAHEMVIPHIDSLNLGSGESLQVAASTSIIADVVRQVAGDRVDMITLTPLGQNPHSYEAPPRVMAQVERAHVVFVNGLNFEEGLMDSISRVATGYVVPVSAGVRVISGDDHDHDHDDLHDDDHDDHYDHDHDDHYDHDHDDPHDDDHDDHYDHDHDHSAGDPHFWFSPLNVIVWTENIARVLGEADPRNRSFYETNATAYVSELRALHEEIRARIAEIPHGDRRLVMDHVALSYYAREYDLHVAGAIIPNVTDQVEPSARHLAALTEVIRDDDIRAILVGGTASRGLRNLVRAVADEVGREIAIAEILTESLAPQGSPGDTYLDFMRYNTAEIVNALKR